MEPVQGSKRGSAPSETSKDIPVLVDSIRSEDGWTRRDASEQLLTLAYFNSAEIVEAGIHQVFMEMLVDDDDYVRDVGIDGIKCLAYEQCGAIMEAGAVGSLLCLLADARPWVRMLSASALRIIAKKGGASLIVDAEALPTIMGLLDDPDPDVRRAASGLIGSIAVHDAQAVVEAGGIKALCRVLERGEPCGGALTALTTIAEREPSALRGLGVVERALPLLAAMDMRGSVVSLLAVMAKNDPVSLVEMGALDPLIGLLDDGDLIVRERAARTIGYIAEINGPSVIAGDAVPRLVELLDDRDAPVRESALSALNEIRHWDPWVLDQYATELAVHSHLELLSGYRSFDAGQGRDEMRGAEGGHSLRYRPDMLK